MVVQYFTAPWCTACKGSKPHVIQACRDKGIPFVEIDIDKRENEDTVIRANVCSLPTLVVLDDEGHQCARMEGAMPKQRIIEILGSDF